MIQLRNWMIGWLSLLGALVSAIGCQTATPAAQVVKASSSYDGLASGPNNQGIIPCSYG